MSSKMEQLLSVLNKALTLEYKFIVHYPRSASMVKDADIRKLVNGLGSAFIKHADVVADAIIRLGGRPSWSFDALPSQVDLVDIFPDTVEQGKGRSRFTQAIGICGLG